ncbi:MAG: hypothetical protein WC365_08260 [Candidatus Babeliales bacterium]|jgi:hypothetical protein
MGNTIKLFVPPVASTEIENELVELTKEITNRILGGRRQGGGLLGGYYGYGTNYENEVFMLHQYCWCEKNDCPWCNECCCVPKSEGYLDGKPISNWSKENEKIVAPLPWNVAKEGTVAYKKAVKEFDDSIIERDKRLKIVYPEIIHHCKYAPMMANRKRGDSWLPQVAPNFWHKSSGLKIWWYKWIGREMKYDREPRNWAKIYEQCLVSIKEELF